MAEKKKKKSIFKKWWFYVGIIAVLALIGAIQDLADNGKIDAPANAEVKEKKETKKEVKKEVNKEETSKEQLEKAIIDKMGKKTNEGKKTIVEIEDGEYTKVVINGDQTLSNKDMKINMLRETTKVFPIIFKDKNVQKAMVTVKTTFVDKYGKESDDDGVRVLLTRETNDKIVWNNFDVNNYGDIAESLYVHPAITKAANE